MSATNTIGIKLLRGVGGIFSEIAEVIGIGDINVVTETEEVTTYNDMAKRYISKLSDGGSVTLTLNFDITEAVQMQIRADQKANLVRTYRILFPFADDDANKPKWEFDALVTSFGTAQPLNGKIVLNLTLKITGQPELVSVYSNDLSGLIVATADLAPAFAPGTYDYISTVANLVTDVSVTPTAALGVITVNGVEVPSGQASGIIDLAVGLNTIFVRVQEADKGAREYTVRIGRLAA